MNDTNNQQERLLDQLWFAGFFEGEGNISLVQGGQKRILPRASLINTDFTLIENCSRILNENNIGHYVQLRKNGCANNPMHKDAKVILIAGHKRILAFINTFLPFFRGRKASVAKLVKEYGEYRLSVPRSTPYTHIDVEYTNRVRTLNKKGPNVSSETIRWTPGKRQDEDIVQAA
jgi:hypothetical protein